MWNKFFLQEYKRHRWIFTIFFPIYISLYYTILQPVKGEVVSYDYPKYYDIFASIMLLLGMIFCNISLPLIFKNYFKKETWSLKKFWIWFVFMMLLEIFIGYIFDYNVHSNHDFKSWTVAYFTQYSPHTDWFLIISLLFYFFIYNPEIKKTGIENTQNSILDNEVLNLINTSENDKVLIISDNQGKPQLEIPIEHVYYITTAENYIEIYSKKNEDNTNNTLQRQIFRNTLKSVETQNAHISALFRCHKAYIVNTEKVKAIKGNTKAYFLAIPEFGLEIPVSRQKNSELEKRFAHLL